MRRSVVLVVILATALLPRTASAASSQTFTVTNANGTGPGSLDDAITQANGNADPAVADKIVFAIAGSGPFIINPPNELPDITQPVTIDGYTQSGATPNDLTGPGTDAVIEIAISMLHSEGDFGLVVDAPNVTVRGLAFNNSRLGIDVERGARVRIEGDFFGTDTTGATPDNNGTLGIEAGGSGLVVGGAEPADRNLISGNASRGIEFRTAGAKHVTIENNIVGLKPDGATALGNGDDGILVRNVPNSQILIAHNVIATNIANGISIEGGGSATRVLSNSIFLNGDLGIGLDGDHLLRPNDHKDPDRGTNHLQNYPVLTSAVSGRTLVAKGMLDSRPRHKYLIQFFANSTANEDGELLIGQKKLKTRHNGTKSFTISFPPQPGFNYVTATATDLRTHDTSEFSVPVLIS